LPKAAGLLALPQNELRARSSQLTFRSKSRKPPDPLNETALYDYAVKALGRRMRTESELRRLLVTRAQPGSGGEAAIKAVVAQLKENRYLDDRSYAETYARLRQENEKFGARRVRQDLRQKGISSALTEQAVDARYSETNEEALARAHLERKRIRKPESEKETARIVRRLMAAGFSTGVIYKILRRWGVSDESLAALDNLAENSSEE
jgi:regulatory protein